MPETSFGECSMHAAVTRAVALLVGRGEHDMAGHLADAALTLRPDAARPVLTMTWPELERLPEYSATVPTGTTEGKRWRRNRDARGRGGYGTPTSRWMIGEYGPPEGDSVPITWYDVEVQGVERPARTPADDAREAIERAIGCLHVINFRARTVTRWYGQPGGGSLDVAEEVGTIAEMRIEAHRALVEAWNHLAPPTGEPDQEVEP